MSIVTKTGDDGSTGLMYNRRVSKCDPRVDAYGTVDELTAAIGVARAWNAENHFVTTSLSAIQKDLIILMGELATAPEDLPRYERDGFQRVGPAMTASLEVIVAKIESQQITFRGWALPGSSPAAAGLDLARTIGRRAERTICALHQSHQLHNPEVLIYLNRLSDLLWLLARSVEQQTE